MREFIWNIAFAVAWAFALGEFHFANFAAGFALGYLVLWFAGHAVGPSPYYRKVGQLVRFLGFYFWELILANFRVAYDVMTPTHHMRSGFVAIPLDAETDDEIALLANLLTLTPGTLSLDVSADRKTLFVHAMYIDDPEKLRRDLKARLERRVLELMR